MKTRKINPTPWLQHFQLNHAIEVTGGDRVLYLSGQTSSDPDGSTLHKGDMVAQFAEAWNNLKAAFAEAGMDPQNVIRLNIFTTDMQTFMEKADDLVACWATDGIQPVCTLLGVSALFDPDLMVEIEATAVA